MFEPVDLPVKEFKAACEREGVPWRKENLDTEGMLPAPEESGEFILCDIGQTVYRARPLDRNARKA